jgi:hypothetical protein
MTNAKAQMSNQIKSSNVKNILAVASRNFEL